MRDHRVERLTHHTDLVLIPDTDLLDAEVALGKFAGKILDLADTARDDVDLADDYDRNDDQRRHTDTEQHVYDPVHDLFQFRFLDLNDEFPARVAHRTEVDILFVFAAAEGRLALFVHQNFIRGGCKVLVIRDIHGGSDLFLLYARQQPVQHGGGKQDRLAGRTHLDIVNDPLNRTEFDIHSHAADKLSVYNDRAGAGRHDRVRRLVIVRIREDRAITPFGIEIIFL